LLLGESTSNWVDYSTDVFRLSSTGETVSLYSGDQLIDQVTYEDMDKERFVAGSIGRYVDGADDDWSEFALATPGASNVEPSGIADDVRPVGWRLDSHQSKSPDVDATFGVAEQALQRFEITFEFEQWNASFAYMNELSGTFGAGGGGGGGGGGMMMGGGGMMMGGGGDMPPMNGNGTRAPRPTGAMPDNTAMPPADGGAMPPDGAMPPMPAVPPPAMMGAGGGGDAGALVADDPLYVWCTIRFLGRIWKRVGFRFKGNVLAIDSAGRSSFHVCFHTLRKFFTSLILEFGNLQGSFSLGFRQV
jgi:hypothetical protein